MLVGTIRWLTIFTLGLAFSACSLQQGGGPKVTIHFPSAASMNTAMNTAMNTLSKPATANQSFDWNRVCYIVNVTGPGIAESQPNCEIPTGKLKGSVAPGDSISIEVERGANRKIEIFAFMRSFVSEPCPTIANGFGSLNRQRISLVGVKENVSIQSDNENVEVTLAYPSVADGLIAKYGLATSCLPTIDPDSVAHISSSRMQFYGSGLTVNHSVSSPPSDFKAVGSSLMIRANIRRN